MKLKNLIKQLKKSYNKYKIAYIAVGLILLIFLHILFIDLSSSSDDESFFILLFITPIFLILFIVLSSKIAGWLSSLAIKNLWTDSLEDFGHLFVYLGRYISWVLLYYFSVTLLYFILIKVTLIKIPTIGLAIPDLNDSLILTLAFIMSFIPRMTFYTNDIKTSRKVLFSIFTPLAVIWAVIFLNTLDVNNLGNFFVNAYDFFKIIDYKYLIAGTFIIVFIGDLSLYLCMKWRIIEFNFKNFTLDELKDTIDQKRHWSILPLLKEWKSVTGNERIKFERALQYAYQVSRDDSEWEHGSKYLMKKRLIKGIDKIISFPSPDLKFILLKYEIRISIDEEEITDIISKYKNYLKITSDEFERLLVNSCIRDLRCDSNPARETAKNILSILVPPHQDTLIEALSDENPHLRYNLAKILGDSGEKAAIEPLAKIIGESKGPNWVISSAVDAIIKLCDEDIEDSNVIIVVNLLNYRHKLGAHTRYGLEKNIEKTGMKAIPELERISKRNDFTAIIAQRLIKRIQEK